MASAPDRQSGFGALLRQWRGERKVSQLTLALEADLSQRHLSFVESGRSRPSRDAVHRLCAALEVPLRERNQFLLAAGFAPEFPESPLAAPALAPVFDALQMLLAQQEPFPAIVIDRHWDVLLANEASSRLFGCFLDPGCDPAAIFPDGRRNVLRFTCHPQGLRPAICNWDDAAPALLERVRAELRLAPGDQRLRDLLTEIEGYAPLPRRPPQAAGARLPVAPLRLARDGVEANLFSAIATLGTPLDVTLQELRIELFFPADARTAELAASLAG